MVIFSIRNGKYVKFVWFLLIIFGGSVHGQMPPRPKPSTELTYAAEFARWMVSEGSWGILSTIADDLGGAPFGNVVSFSDGLPNGGNGIPYFYLASYDPDPNEHYGWKDRRSSLAISEYALGTCGKIDPQNPTCSKITLTGKLVKVDENSEEATMARKGLFAKHAEMQNWPKEPNFQVFKLDIDKIFMINNYDGPKHMTVNQYLHPNT